MGRHSLETDTTAPYVRRCRCGHCTYCLDLDKWDRVWRAKFAGYKRDEPGLYRSALSGGSTAVQQGNRHIGDDESSDWCNW